MNVGQGSKELIHVEFDLKHGHRLLEFGVVATGSVHSFGYIFEDKVEIDFVFL